MATDDEASEKKAPFSLELHRLIIAGSVFVVVVITTAVGLGVGLTRHQHVASQNK